MATHAHMTNKRQSEALSIWHPQGPLGEEKGPGRGLPVGWAPVSTVRPPALCLVQSFLSSTRVSGLLGQMKPGWLSRRPGNAYHPFCHSHQ